jgi:hypothetical protein
MSVTLSVLGSSFPVDGLGIDNALLRIKQMRAVQDGRRILIAAP